MKFYTSIPKGLKPYYKSELDKYQTEYSNGNLKNAWNHLERAHIIGQKYPYEHTFVHWEMFRGMFIFIQRCIFKVGFNLVQCCIFSNYANKIHNENQVSIRVSVNILGS